MSITTKIDTEMRKKILGEKSLTMGELIGLIILLVAFYLWYSKTFIKDIKFWVVFVIVLIMFALW